MHVQIRVLLLCLVGLEMTSAAVQLRAEPMVRRGAGEREKAEVEQVEVLGASGEMNPVSTAVKCVMNLTIQYLSIYTVMAILRVVADFQGQNLNDWTVGESLKQACITVNYAPMLAIMFLAARMRVLWLTQLKGNPPIWMQQWMYGATYSVLAMTLVALVVPLLTGQKYTVNPETGEPDPDHKPFENQIAAICFTVLKYLIMIGLYVG